MRKRIWYSPPSFLLCGRATAIFARFASKNRKFHASKKPTVGFFVQGDSSMTQPLPKVFSQKASNRSGLGEFLFGRIEFGVLCLFERVPAAGVDLIEDLLMDAVLVL